MFCASNYDKYNNNQEKKQSHGAPVTFIHANKKTLRKMNEAYLPKWFFKFSQLVDKNNTAFLSGNQH